MRHAPLVSEVDISSEDVASARMADPRDAKDFDNLDVYSYVAQTERMSPKLLMAKEHLERQRSENRVKHNGEEAWKTDRKQLNDLLAEFEDEVESQSPFK